MFKKKRDIYDHTRSAFFDRHNEIKNQTAIIISNIHEEIGKLHKLLDQRKRELVASLDLQVTKKVIIQELANQRKCIEKHKRIHTSNCLEYAEELKTGMEGEILKMKAHVLKQYKEITAEFDLDAL